MLINYDYYYFEWISDDALLLQTYTYAVHQCRQGYVRYFVYILERENAFSAVDDVIR